MNDGWVYFVREEGDGPIKIGFTGTSTSDRLKDLQRGNSRVLHLIALFEGVGEDESRWHRRFRHARIQGEWFRPTPDLLVAIAQECATGDALIAKLVEIEDLGPKVLAVRDWMEATGHTCEKIAAAGNMRPETVRRALSGGAYYDDGLNLRLSRVIAKLSGGLFAVEDVYYDSNSKRRWDEQLSAQQWAELGAAQAAKFERLKASGYRQEIAA